MVGILLCTYNGEQYLSQQLDSILAQSYEDYKIYISDDGSSDGTVSVIYKYIAGYPQKVVFVSSRDKHKGAAQNFMWLLEQINEEYYMFCDQDDIWLPDKISHTMQKMKQIEQRYPNSPVLVHTDLHVCDSELNIIHPSFWEYRHLLVDVSKDFRYLCFGNIVTGCTMMINQQSKRVSLPYRNDTYLHDYWIALMTAKFGHIDNIKEQTVLYRQHGNNVAGIGRKFEWGIHLKSFFQWWKDERPVIKKLGYSSDWEIFVYRFHYFLMRYFNCKY